MKRLILLILALGVATSLAWLLPKIDKSPKRFDVAMRLLEDGRSEDAAILFENHAWRGVAQYRAERYRRALSEFVIDESVLTLYNMGNSYLRLYEWAGAIAAYQKALLLDPNHEDARHNLSIVRKAEALERAQFAEKNNERKLGHWQHGDQEKEDQNVPGDEALNNDQPTKDQDTRERMKQPTQDSADRAGSSDISGLAGEEAAFDDAIAGSAHDSWHDEAQSDLNISSKAALIRRESRQAAHILLRQIKDDPARVLSARLLAAHRLRMEQGRACVGC